jgi:4-nitrophenyl phosphatase
MAVSGAIVDLDGTVYRGDALLPGASAGLDALRGAGVDVLFFSNNPLKDEAAYLDRLSGLGLDVSGMAACSSGVVTTEYLTANHAEDHILLIGADPLRDQLEAAGLALTDDPARADVVVASWTPTFGYDDMQTTLDAVDGETAFLGTDPDRTFPMDDDRLVPGSGAVVGAVEATVGREPDAVLGKPSEQALQAALDRLDTEPEDCLVVGDRLDTDLAMGARAGMTTVLVLTGVTERADVVASDIDPDWIIDSLGDIDEVLAAL